MHDGWHVVSFSHFLPRPELHRGYRVLEHFEGSHVLGEQVATLHRGAASSTHVFGHTHWSMDRTLDGIRYVQHPLGNPHERKNGYQIFVGEPMETTALGLVWSRAKPKVRGAKQHEQQARAAPAGARPREQEQQHEREPSRARGGGDKPSDLDVLLATLIT